MFEARLNVLGGKHEGKAIPLPLGRFLIGRERDCHLRPSSESVSRHHCVFYVDQYSVRLRDLGSLNGTLVNGERLHGESTLSDGDEIRVGALDFRLSLVEAVQPAEGPAVPAGQVFGDTAVMASTETVYELPTGTASGQPTPVPVASQPAAAPQQPAQPPQSAPPGYGYPQQGSQQGWPGQPMWPGQQWQGPQQPWPGQPWPGQPQQPWPGQPWPGQPWPGQPGPPQQGGHQQGGHQPAAPQQGGNRIPAPPVKLPPPPEPSSH